VKPALVFGAGFLLGLAVMFVIKPADMTSVCCRLVGFGIKSELEGIV
jgi:hypothetical protein